MKRLFWEILEIKINPRIAKFRNNLVVKMKTNWPTKKLKDLLESFDAGMWGKPAPEGKGLLILRSTNITNEGSLDFSNVAELDIQNKIEKLKLFDGDILLEKSGGGPDQPVGRVAYFVAPNHRVYSFANFIQRIRARSDLIDSRFLFYRLLLLHKIGFTKKLQSQTTGIRNLKLSLYLKTEIPLPPLKIQKQIVERLDKIAEAQKLNDELIQKSDELFQSLLHQELDSASRDWELKKLGEVCEKIIQAHPSKFFKRSFHYIDISSINSKSKTVEAFSTCSIDQAPSRARKLVQKNDILFATTRPYLENIAIVPDTCEDFVASTGFCVIRANTEYTTHDFLFFNVISRPFIRKILPFQRGANYPAVSDKNVYGIKIPLPPLETQKQIVEKLSAAQEYKKQLLEQKLKLKELFDSVLHKSIE